MSFFQQPLFMPCLPMPSKQTQKVKADYEYNENQILIQMIQFLIHKNNKL